MDGHDQTVRELYMRVSAQEILGYATDFERWASRPDMVPCAPGLRLAANVLRFVIGNSATFGAAENASPAGDPPVG